MAVNPLPSPMTATQILKEVKERADARMGETIERLFPLVRNYHAHQAWRGECYCQYCDFIRNQYVPYKMQIHKLKKRIRYLEWANGDVESQAAYASDKRLTEMMLKLREVKQHKCQLKQGND